jgi:uncharacterized protein YkwD
VASTGPQWSFIEADERTFLLLISEASGADCSGSKPAVTSDWEFSSNLFNPMRLSRYLHSLCVFLLAVMVCALLTYPCLSQTQFDAAGEQQLIKLINQERDSQGRQPLTVDPRLTQAAQKHTILMVQHQALAHQFDGEPSLQLRFGDENFPSDRQAENVGFAKDVLSDHQGFMHSPPHRANILDPSFNAVGVAVMRSRGEVYVTEDFGHRIEEYSEPEADDILQKAIEGYAAGHGMATPVRQPQSQLRHMACDMALNNSLQGQKASELPGVEAVAVWTAAAPAELPSVAKNLLSRASPAKYSLGACFAPSVSHPGGVYWIVMVVY